MYNIRNAIINDIKIEVVKIEYINDNSSDQLINGLYFKIYNKYFYFGMDTDIGEESKWFVLRDVNKIETLINDESMGVEYDKRYPYIADYGGINEWVKANNYLDFAHNLKNITCFIFGELEKMDIFKGDDDD